MVSQIEYLATLKECVPAESYDALIAKHQVDDFREMCIDFRCLLLILTAYRRLSNISKDLHTLLILRISCKFLCFVFTCIACYWF